MPGRRSKTGVGRKIKGTSGMVLGKSLQRDRVKQATSRRKGQHINTLGGMHTSELDADAGSITQTNSLADFLATAAMAERDFRAERGKVLVMGNSNSTAGFVDPGHLRLLKDIDKNEIRQLQIPKRPKFHKGQTPEEFDLAERTAFLDWRRRIAELEKSTKDAVATPFEKNLNMWRQLWRVIERSDVLVQIVDARNPLLYRSEDLEDYIDEVGGGTKRKLLILNKADYLCYELREQWARYLTGKGIDFIFFSAKLITDALEAEEADARRRELEEAELEAVNALQKEISSLSATGPEAAGTTAAAGADATAGAPAAPAVAVAATAAQKAEANPTTVAVDNSRSAGGGNAFDALMESDEEEDVEDEDDDDEGEEAAAAAAAAAPAGGQVEVVTPASLPSVPAVAEAVELVGAGGGAPREEAEEAAASASVTAAADKDAGAPATTAAAAASGATAASAEAPAPASSAQAEAGVERQQQSAEALIREKTRILSRQQVLDLLESFHDKLSHHSAEDEAAQAAGRSATRAAAEGAAITVGMIGFPNVGKSSCINALLGITATTHTKKRVAVAAQPGRTKHFQTLELTDSVVLCDCPGLVFPSFMNSKADMIINGILPLEQMRDYILPCALITRRIPRAEFEAVYGLDLEWRSEDGSALTWVDLARQTLTAHATKRGFMVHTVGADLPRSARVICKDFVSGKLLYCNSPPGFKTPASTSYATTSRGSGGGAAVGDGGAGADGSAEVVGNMAREQELFEQMDRTDELVVEGKDGSALCFLSPQALKQLEKEKIILEKKKLRQQKRQSKLNSGKGKIKGGRKKRGTDNPYGDNADDMFFDRSSLELLSQQHVQDSTTQNQFGFVAKPATRGTATLHNAKVAAREAVPPKPTRSGRR